MENIYIETGQCYRKKLSEQAQKNYPDSYITEDLPQKEPIFEGIFHKEGAIICPQCGRDTYRLGVKLYCPTCMRQAREAYYKAVSDSEPVEEIELLRKFALDMIADKIINGEIKV